MSVADVRKEISEDWGKRGVHSAEAAFDHVLHAVKGESRGWEASPLQAWHQDGGIMTSEVVSLEVIASIPIDCDFWSEDDGWQGLCKSLSVTVRGSSFEDAKKNMAGELQVHIERVLREHSQRSARRIA